MKTPRLMFACTPDSRKVIGRNDAASEALSERHTKRIGFSDPFGDADGALEKASGSCIVLKGICSDSGHCYQFSA